MSDAVASLEGYEILRQTGEEAFRCGVWGSVDGRATPNLLRETPAADRLVPAAWV